MNRTGTNALPMISCIMPVYNAEKYLRVAIDSILNQTYKDFELIIINDGSTDKSAEIIKSYDDPRIIYSENESNLKLIKTLNKGIDMARGSYISRMDSDDQAIETLFEEEIDAFKRHGDVGIINVLTNHMSEDGIKIRPNLLIGKMSKEALPIVNNFQNMISHPGVMVKASLIKKYKYLDNDLVVHFEDLDLWCRMFEDGISCYTINKRLLNYRESKNSINSKYGVERYSRNLKYNQIYIKRRYLYSFPSIAAPSTIKNIIRYHIELSRFFKYLLINNYIKTSVATEIVFWQMKIILGQIKKLFV